MTSVLMTIPRPGSAELTPWSSSTCRFGSARGERSVAATSDATSGVGCFGGGAGATPSSWPRSRSTRLTRRSSCSVGAGRCSVGFPAAADPALRAALPALDLGTRLSQHARSVSCRDWPDRLPTGALAHGRGSPISPTTSIWEPAPKLLDAARHRQPPGRVRLRLASTPSLRRSPRSPGVCFTSPSAALRNELRATFPSTSRSPAEGRECASARSSPRFPADAIESAAGPARTRRSVAPEDRTSPSFGVLPIGRRKGSTSDREERFCARRRVGDQRAPPGGQDLRRARSAHPVEENDRPAKRQRALTPPSASPVADQSKGL